MTVYKLLCQLVQAHNLLEQVCLLLILIIRNIYNNREMMDTKNKYMMNKITSKQGAIGK